MLFIGFLLGGLIGYLAYRAGALTAGGAWAAGITGGLIFGLGGLPWAVLLLAFFLASSALSRVFSARKASLAEKFAKGSNRDAGQVLANGGLGAGLVLLHALLPFADWIWVAYAGAIAAVNADTWATELGVLSTEPPRLITNGRVVEKGSSGGVSLGGYLAAFAGSGLIAALAWLLTPWMPRATIIGGAVLGGLGGSTLDSVLGATVQAIYYCPACEKETERHPAHGCGTETVLVRGWEWLDNDLVNFLSSLFGAGIAIGVWLLLLYL
jgi:uncharacterized protein (TIGR00297 family)